jgi:hypothetical protein
MFRAPIFHHGLQYQCLTIDLNCKYCFCIKIFQNDPFAGTRNHKGYALIDQDFEVD